MQRAGDGEKTGYAWWASPFGGALLLLLGGCKGPQSVLHPQGPEAERIATAGWTMFGGACVIFLLVMALATVALVRGPRHDWLGSNTLIVAGGLIFTTVTLTALLIYSFAVSGIAAWQPASDPEIEVVGYQWWWEVRYRAPNGDIVFTTANEVRLPAGRPVRIRVTTADVIHSFWVPNLAGKVDMIPGRTNELTLVD